MADNNRTNDDYQIADIDDFSSESLIDSQESAKEPVELDNSNSTVGELENSHTRRNALIAIGFVVLLIIFYKLLSPIVHKSTVVSLDKNSTSVEVSKPVTLPKVNKSIQYTPPKTVESSKNDEQIMQKLAASDENQQAMKVELNALSTTIVTINNAVNDLNYKLSDINQSLASISSRIDSQAQAIKLLTIKPMVKSPIKKIVKMSYPKFYLQAVIPGRAWLISQNGTTITIREGTRLPGYGIVRLIDPSQGQILTSSGKTIRFDQQDN